MQSRLCLVLLLALLSSSGPSAAERETKLRPTCAVLPFEVGGDVKDADAKFITDRFSTLLPKIGKYDVVAKGRINEILKVAEFNRAEFSSPTEFAIEMGKILQVRYVIHGAVGHMGSLYSLNTSVVDVETARVVETAVTDIKGDITEFAERGAEENIRALFNLEPMKPAPVQPGAGDKPVDGGTFTPLVHSAEAAQPGALAAGKQQARQSLALNQVVLAAMQLKQLHQVFPDDAEASRMWVLAEISVSGDLRAAHAEAVRLVKAAPGDAQALFLHGQTCLALGDVQAAQRSLNAARQAAPQLVEGIYQEACNFNTSGVPSIAYTQYAALVSMNPPDTRAYYGLGFTALALGRTQEAVTSFQTYLNYDSFSPFADQVRAQLNLLLWNR